jgi:hypothetical protein
MISWCGTVNIPVEDNSYKWSKKIFKTQAAPQFETGMTKTSAVRSRKAQAALRIIVIQFPKYRH